MSMQKKGKTHQSAQKPECSMPKCAEKKTECSEPMMMKQTAGKSAKTKIVVKHDCGFGNKLFIRGEGISILSWNHGIPLENCGPSKWVLETDRPFSVAKFKILLNDNEWEQGENHIIAYGKEAAFNPAF